MCILKLIKGLVKLCLFLLAALLVVLMLLSTSGCGAQPEIPTHLAIVVEAHANAGSIQYDSETIRQSMYQVCYGYHSSDGSVTMVRCDGDAQVVFQSPIPSPRIAGLDEDKLNAIAENYIVQLQSALRDIQAQAPEVDTLKSINLAAKALEDKTGEKNLLVLDSGLSTTGYLDFASNPQWLEGDPSELAAALETEFAIPDLRGVNVYWCYCGQTALPQAELSEKQKESLIAIWSEILRTGGASSITFCSDFAGLPVEGQPPVRTVEARDRTILYKPLPTIILDSRQVEFIGDTDLFVNQSSASAALETVAQSLQNHPNNQVFIVGSTATGANAEFCDQLSKKRATAVAKALLAYGVTENQIAGIFGMGYHDPWHISDLDSQGRQIEALARQNRKVMIIDTTGEDAAQLIITP